MKRAAPNRLRTVVPIAFAVGLLLPAAARAQDVLSLIRAGNWPAADAAAAQVADPVARKLVLYYRLLTPNAATLDELTAFLNASPDWPNRALLTRRRDEALTAEADAGAAMRVCEHGAPPVASV